MNTAVLLNSPGWLRGGIDYVTAYERTAAPSYADLTLLLWEYLITVDDEIDLFWSSKLSWIKCLFFVNRDLVIGLRVWDTICGYFPVSILPLRAAPSNASDGFWIVPSLAPITSITSWRLRQLFLNPESVVYAMVTIQILVMESIIILRLWAITGRRGVLLTFFCFLLFLNAAATLVVYFTVTNDVPVGDQDLTLYSWLSMLLFEVIVFLTTIFYGLREVKATKILTQVRQNFGPKPIMGLLLRDSVFYFLIVLCCALVQGFVDTGLGLSLMSVTITRMLLRLRKRI
ncbi:hypothetical protein EDD85DRAFT_981988 [Armillaria nabsnona]|nr:hypothetical protein EDD85DRAFT_981988 [Armillaria nabsnona]